VSVRAIALAGLLVACGVQSDVSRSVGARCDVNDDCDGRCLLPSVDYPHGFCTLDCDDDSDCPGNAACVTTQGNVCLFRCDEQTDCEFIDEFWMCLERPSAETSEPEQICIGG
jgi:hypothetical protein